MKTRLSLLFLVSLLLLPLASTARAEEAPFRIDARHVYDDMPRCYDQGYAPTVKGNSVLIVLPLLSDLCQGEITATFAPDDLCVSPVKLQPFTKTFAKRAYKFGEETVNAYRVFFKLSLHDTRVNGEYPCAIRVCGSDAQGGALTASFPFVLRVTDGAENPETPVVSASGFRLSQSPLRAGETASAFVTLRNESATRAISALTLRFEADDLLPLASNVTRVGALGAGETVSLELPFRVTETASSAPRAFALSLQYEYANAQRAEASETFYVDVRQQANLLYSQASFPARVTQGDTPAFQVSLVNAGQCALKNVQLTFALPGLDSGGGVYVGAIPVGESKTASANFKTLSDFLGESKGSATVSYEDDYGESYTVEIPLSTLVEQKAALSYAAKEEKPEEAPLPLWIGFALAGALALGLVIQGALYRRKLRALEERRL